MMNEPCSGFSFIARPHSLVMISWIASARRTDSGVGVVTASSKALVCSELQLSYSAMSACSVVRMSLKCISCACSDRPDVCTWYFSFWRPLAGAVLVPHRHRPDAPRHPTDDGVLGVHPVGEEEGQARREIVDGHPARDVRLDVGEGVGQRERQLADRVRPGLGDVIAGDGHRVEVAHAVGDEPLLHVGHAAQREFGGEQAGVLALILLEDVGLHGAADGLDRVRPGLVDDGVEEHGQDRRARGR